MALPCKRLYGHLSSGSEQGAENNTTRARVSYKLLLIVFITTNAAASLAQLLGTIVFFSSSLAGGSTSAHLRHGIFLVCPWNLLSCSLTLVGLHCCSVIVLHAVLLGACRSLPSCSEDHLGRHRRLIGRGHERGKYLNTDSV